MFQKIKRKYIEFWVKLSNRFNRSAKTIFFYTDSRGHDVLGNFKGLHKGSYIEYFLKRYKVYYHICPEKYTTIADFLVFAEKIDLTKYNYVVLHCGVVDFSPRPLSNIENVKASKKGNKFFDYLFRANEQYYANPSDTIYYNEKTINLYSPLFLKEHIIAKLCKIENLVWIDSNHFVSGWEGNFKKGRPSNIEDFITGFDEIMSGAIRNVVSIKDWNEEQIKEFTIDNIHFTKKGFKEMYDRIEAHLQTL